MNEVNQRSASRHIMEHVSKSYKWDLIPNKLDEVYCDF